MLQTLGKSALRATKNYSKGYSHTQIKVRNATCNDPWPPSGKEMYELAQMTFNQNDFVEIMEVIDKRLNDKGKNWRHVFKALVVLDYLLHSGSENVIRYCEENLYEIKTLREFQYIDEDGRDEGANVRRKAADITNLLVDKQRLYRERRTRANMRDRMMGRSRNSNDTDSDDERPRRRPLPNGLDKVAGEEDEDLRRAFEESRKSAAVLRKTAEDEDLERAIRLSQEDEERRRRLVEEANAAALFDDSNQMPPPTTLIDATLPLQYATGLEPQFTSIQPQFTSIAPQFTSFPPQFTSISPQFTSIQPQYTSFNPYLPAAEQEAMQAEYMRQQAEYAQLQQLQAQQTFSPPPQQPLVPQVTSFGSNNPFLPHSPVVTGTPSSPTLPARPVSEGPVQFNLPGTYEGREPPRASSELDRRDSSSDSFLRPFTTGSEPQRRGRERQDERLAALFANYTGDGVDTFGNVGPLRFGQTQFGRLAAQKTGALNPGSRAETSHNPFLQPPTQSQSPSSQEGNLIDL
ncbi:ENTH-domain-containing protein [Lentinus brumalis]|uniref:ENTH-domain-containing protein n=1 Tax=Lentinus brumalis TaxID=2498619 RepID=A0A371CVG0_9APHY|nr:ENTH-domain-containing protein [Polyporus brumalis]